MASKRATTARPSKGVQDSASAQSPGDARGEALRTQFAEVLTHSLASRVNLDDVISMFPTIDASTSAGTEAIADALAVRLIASLPRADEADRRVGPFYRGTDLARWKGLSRQAISKQSHQRKILVIKTKSGTLAYPAWQFDPRGEPLPNLSAVLKILDPDDRDAMGSAMWLNQKAERLNGQTPAELLRAGQTDTVLDVARDRSGR